MSFNAVKLLFRPGTCVVPPGCVTRTTCPNTGSDASEMKSFTLRESCHLNSPALASAALLLNDVQSTSATVGPPVAGGGVVGALTVTLAVSALPENAAITR